MSKNWILMKSFLLAGTFTFAGGIAMLPTLEKEIVTRHQLMSKEDFLDAATLSQAIPGVIGVNFAVLVGKKINGRSGLMVAAIGAMFPAFVLMLIATIVYEYIPQEGALKYGFIGVRAASTSSVFVASLTLGKHLVKTKEHWVIVLMCFVAVGLLNISAPLVIVGAGLVALFQFLRSDL